jgi:hypothetical protein
MWGGIDVLGNLKRFSRDEDFLGLSTYIKHYHLIDEDEDVTDEDIQLEGNEKIIYENIDTWAEIDTDVWNKTKKYFDTDVTYSVKYSGYLLNHTKKLAIDLADYYSHSIFSNKAGIEMAIDAVPVLTETGDGAPMALYGGASADTTEELVGTWCGDLLQIVDELPEGYQLINCCFAERWSKAEHCYYKFGISADGYILKDSAGTRLEVVKFGIIGFQRGDPRYVKVEIVKEQNQIRYSTERKNQE